MTPETLMEGALRSQPGALKLWWRAVRPFAYPASVVPALLGIALAWSAGASLRLGFALLTLLGAVAAHTGSNLLSDYFDFRRGQDRPGTLGGSGLLVDGSLSPGQAVAGACAAFALAALAAIPLCFAVGPPLVGLILAGFLLGAGYSLPPFGLKYRALGDLAVFLAFGVGITLGAYAVQTGAWSWAPVAAAVPPGMLVAAILHANHLRDADDDRAVGTRTVANLIGVRASRWLYAIYVLGAYAVLAVLLFLRHVPYGAAMALATFPLGLSRVLEVWRATPPARGALVAADAKTAQLNLIFGLAMVAGILLWPEG